MEPSPDSLLREKARLRKIGLVILLLGLAGAGLLYWIRNRPEDPALAEYRQSEERNASYQMEKLYGTSGDVTHKLLDAMKRPGNQALAIIALTTLVSGTCFYLGRSFPDDHGAS
ncbi:MAG TPA: hypothetical protein VKV04_15625 [Verrucomicrobiae bacterium]|nr:hypothetical protein [Verrucomicrobiae bacterium]